MAYIYKITNDINNKIYIGKTERSVEQRFKEHCREYKKPRCEQRPLYRAMNKYGIEHFHVEQIEETDNPVEREIYWIEYYNSFHNGYNATQGGDGKPYLDYDLIVKTYQEVESLKKTCEILHIDHTTARRVLRSRHIHIYNSQHSLKRKVAKIDMQTGEILQIYPSVSDADNDHGGGHHIGQVCCGTRASAYGFFWKYV